MTVAYPLLLKKNLKLILTGAAMMLFASTNVVAAGACVVAKTMGNSEAIEWIHSPVSAEAALIEAKEKLKEGGHKDVFPQAVTALQHAYVIILKSDYKSSRGRDRTSYGCGFSRVSYDEALRAAMRNLQSYAWGWKPDREGYEVVVKTKY